MTATRLQLRLEPVDTWFFRDGTPFTMGAAPQENVESLFPPHPVTVAGALRAALARSRGWNGLGRWPQALCDILGDGPDHLGRLLLDGPFLLREGHPLFRAPRHLLGFVAGNGAGAGSGENGSGTWRPSALLHPGPPVVCDLGGAVRLPILAASQPGRAESRPVPERLVPADGSWLTGEGLDSVLRGSLPARSEVVPDHRLWSDEPRIGLERDGDARTAREGMLYSTRHVRPHRGVSLGIRVAGLPSDWTPVGQLLTLGGEGRLAECREWAGAANVAFDVPSAEIEASGKVTIVALTPLDLSTEACLGRETFPVSSLERDRIRLRVVSACLDRPQRVGGWDSVARRPLPLRSVLPSGSTLFCEVDDPAGLDSGALANITAADGLVRVGSRQKWGFGLVALGVWPTPQEEGTP